MKSMTKMMVVAMLLVAALVVAPAAARTVFDTSADGNTIYTIQSGDTIYVGEKNLNFATNAKTDVPPGFGGFESGWLVHFSSITDNNVDKTIAISNARDFELTKSTVGTTTGTYYVFDKAPFTVANALGSVVVDIPSITLDVVLNDSTIDSVDGKSVTRETPLAFKLTNNLAGFRGVTPVEKQPVMKIEVSAPGGGKLTKFGGQDLGTIYANGTTQYIRNILLAGNGDDIKPVEAGTYSAQAVWYADKPGASFYDKGYNSNSVTFEVSPKKLATSSSKDKVVRGNSFTVTVTGESKKNYVVYVKQAGSLTEEEYPQIAEGQPSVTIGGVTNGKKLADGAVINEKDYRDLTAFASTNATIQTNAAGKRDVRFETTQKTDDRQFTIRVQDPKDKTNYDEVKVRVEKGEVTITASGTGVYYIGEEITLSGTNTDSDYVYLFLTGPNLGTNGVKLSDAKTKVVTTDENSFTRENVEADDTWSYKWDTSDLSQVIDAGGYTVYAVATNVSKDDLGDYKYATVSVTLKSAFVTATSSGATVAKGDKLTITGTAQGDPSSVYVWIFGKNKRILAKSASVESDGSFEYKLESGETKDLTAGQYFVVIQHPMTNGFGVDLKSSDSTVITGEGINEVDLAKLQASDAATALVNALDSPNIDDTYTKLTFVVEEPQIFIDPIGDKEAGSKFTISGTTNLAVGDKLIIDVTSAAFQPSKKTETSGFASASGTVTVEKGDGMNKWSFEVDATGFKPDQYIVKIESVETDTTQTANFNVVEAVPTTQTTPVETTPVETTPVETQTTEPTPTQSPGFGALLALAGLGAVAFLVLRRD